MNHAHARTAPLTSGKRSESRLRVRLSAKLVTLDGPQTVVLNDLSTAGAKVTLVKPVAAGRDAVLYWGAFEIFARITWVRGALCGLTFDEILPYEDVLATRDLDTAERLPDERELNRQAAQAWVVGRARMGTGN